MRYQKAYDWGGIVFYGAIGLLLFFSILGGCQKQLAERECLQNGFPEAKVTWMGWGQPYCVIRVQQTDRVIPLEEARGEP